MDKRLFQELVWDKGSELFRDMPWRQNTDPYYILVSEMMLQQTQVDRVIPKFNAFIEAFPDILALASASLADVLILWSGLGYNRRAKYLHDAAKLLVWEYGGIVPVQETKLYTLPGVGPNTAAAILVYGFNQPIGFVETNIRTVYFHHFYWENEFVTDVEVLQSVIMTLDKEHPREWFWALMDYGNFLKKQGAGRITQSAHYKKQPLLRGSVREVRGQIIKALTHGPLSEAVLEDKLMIDDRYVAARDGLLHDGLIKRDDRQIYLTK